MFWDGFSPQNVTFLLRFCLPLKEEVMDEWNYVFCFSKVLMDE